MTKNEEFLIKLSEILEKKKMFNYVAYRRSHNIWWNEGGSH